MERLKTKEKQIEGDWREGEKGRERKEGRRRGRESLRGANIDQSFHSWPWTRG